MTCDLVEFEHPFPDGLAVPNHFGVKVFEVGQHEVLRDTGVVAHIAFCVRVGVSPLSCGSAEYGDVEYVPFLCVSDSLVVAGQMWRHHVLDRIGVDAVVHGGEQSLFRSIRR